MSDLFELVERVPTVDEYQRLRDAVGWGNVNRQATEQALGNALYSVTLTHRGVAVGCGRIVGDGGIYFYIQDIIVLPEYQRRRQGKRIMDAVMGYLERHAPANAFIGLMAATGVKSFYEMYGFAERPADRPGMFRIWPGPREGR